MLVNTGLIYKDRPIASYGQSFNRERNFAVLSRLLSLEGFHDADYFHIHSDTQILSRVTGLFPQFQTSMPSISTEPPTMEESISSHLTSF
jgi:hypothetical protein